MIDDTAWVYMLTSKKDGVLYTGMTTDLPARLFAHREGRGSKFVARYEVTRLVWMEGHQMVNAAIGRETRIKKWPRAWKVRLIEAANPAWDDLYLTLNS
jgi:putative endonuclease